MAIPDMASWRGAGWQDYGLATGRPQAGGGKLLLMPRVYSPQLRNQRHLLAWLPPGYDPGVPYPVFYVQDGQNLFDPATSFGRHWQLAETMSFLAARGRPAIVVGIPNAGRWRIAEYSPFVDRYFGGGLGDHYLRFVSDTVKPLVDRSFSTNPQPAATGLAGASLGGSLALYGVARRSDTFGLAAALSPSCWFAGGALNRHLDRYGRLDGRIYLDMGLRERGAPRQKPSKSGRGGKPRQSGAVHWVYRKLLRKGLAEGRDLLYVLDPDGRHDEFHWSRRFPLAAAFLLKGL